MYCHNCGVPQSDDADFCAQCGAPQRIEPSASRPSATEPKAEAAADGASQADGRAGFEQTPGGAAPAAAPSRERTVTAAAVRAPAPPASQEDRSEHAAPAAARREKDPRVDGSAPAVRMDARAPAERGPRVDAVTSAEEAATRTDADIPPAHAAMLRDRRSRARAGSILLWLVTAVWVSLVSLHAYANWPVLSQLEASGWWDYVVRATAPIVVLWLAIGYFQLAARLRSSAALQGQAARLVAQNEEASRRVSELVKQAGTALTAMEAELAKLRDQERARSRAVQPRWEVNGCIAHEKVHEINLRNSGAAASGLSAAWDKSAPMAVLLSESAFVDRGAHLAIKVVFLDARLDEFQLKLQYFDGANEPRVADIAVSNMDVTLRHEDV